MKKYLLLAFLCASNIAFADHKQDLLTTVALFVESNKDRFPDENLLSALEKHKGGSDLKTALEKVLTNKQNKEIRAKMAADEKYQVLEKHFLKIINKTEEKLLKFGGMLKVFENEPVKEFVRMQIRDSELTPETFTAITAAIETLEKTVEKEN